MSHEDGLLVLQTCGLVVVFVHSFGRVIHKQCHHCHGRVRICTPAHQRKWVQLLLHEPPYSSRSKPVRARARAQAQAEEVAVVVQELVVAEPERVPVLWSRLLAPASALVKVSVVRQEIDSTWELGLLTYEEVVTVSVKANVMAGDRNNAHQPSQHST